MSAYNNHLLHLAHAASKLADEASESEAGVLITADHIDVSVSYLRGAQDMLEYLAGVWDAYELPGELAAIIDRSNEALGLRIPVNA